MIKGVIFDKDGTLLDFDALWLPVAEGAIDAVIKEYSLPQDAKQKLFESIGVFDGETDITGVLAGGTYQMMADCFKKVLDEYGINYDKDKFDDFTVKSFHDSFDKGEIRPACDGIAEFFERLKAMDIKIALITSDDRFGADRCLNKFGIAKYFDEIYCADGINPPKPDPYYMNCFAAKYALQKDELCMVGDTYVDCDFAEAGKAMMIGVARSHANKAKLFKRTERVYDDISHIPFERLTSPDPQHTGELYLPGEPERAAHQQNRLEMLYDFNATRPSEYDKRCAMLKKMFAEIGDRCYIEPPLHANMACEFVHFGDGIYANFGLTLVDDTAIYVGDHTMFGPNVIIATAAHPIEPHLREMAYQKNSPVRIGKNCWLGAGVIVLPGVTIGDNTVVGAGSVVTHDLPANVVAVGVPCKVIKNINSDNSDNNDQ